jgi:hypothetical protein
MINLSRQQLIVLGIVILIVIILLSVGISVAYLAPTQWKGHEQVVVPGRGPLTNAAPALAVDDNTLYLVYKEHSGNTIYWSRYDGSHWEGDEQVVVTTTVPGLIRREPHTDAAPALAVYDNKLYLVYRGHYTDTIWSSWYEGGQWKGDEQVKWPGSEPLTDAAPALAVDDNKLYLVYKGPSAVDAIWWSWYEDGQWKGNEQVVVTRTVPPPRREPHTNAAPALAVYDNKLYLVYKGHHSVDTIWWSWYEGGQWKGDEPVVVPGREPLTDAAPALAVYGDKLYLVYKDDSGTIWWSWYDGREWKGHEPVGVPGRKPLTDAAPALAVYDNKLYLVYKGHSVDNIWWSWYVRRWWSWSVRR